MATIKVKEAIRRVEEAGWRLVATRGSHRHFKHPTIPGRVTIPGKLSDNLTPGTWNNIQRQAGWRR